MISFPRADRKPDGEDFRDDGGRRLVALLGMRVLSSEF